MEKSDVEVKNLAAQDGIEKMKELIDHNAICLFTTNLRETHINTRPMTTQQVDDDGNFWFFSAEDSHKNLEISKDDRVQLFFSNPGDAEFMTVHGMAEILHNKQKIEELWSPIVKAWFKGGKDDEALSLIKVIPDDVYYWDTKTNKMISLIKILGAALTNKTFNEGVEGEINPKVL